MNTPSPSHQLSSLRFISLHFQAVCLGLVLALALLTGGQNAQAQFQPPPLEQEGDQVWGTIIVGHLIGNAGGARTSPSLVPYHRQLKEIFGYDVFQIVDEVMEERSGDGQELSMATRQFSVKLESLGLHNGKLSTASADDSDQVVSLAGQQVYEFRLKLYQHDQLVVETTVEVTRGSPFYVRGPVWGERQIIIMLMVA
jgi:hypothetical protein